MLARDGLPIRVRCKLAEGNPSNRSGANNKRRLMPLVLARPWYMAPSATFAAAAAGMAASHQNNAAAAGNESSPRWAGHNSAGAAQPAGEKAKVNKEDIRPMPYHDYNPIIVRNVQSDEELPIHYWFYVYLYSSDVDRLLTPFVKLEESFGTDRRLVVIMNRCGVQILLKDLELYKSLPRRIVVIKAAQWSSVVKALLEMEERLPDLMRFATYPLLLDTDTTKYACTKFDRTACISRITKPMVN